MNGVQEQKHHLAQANRQIAELAVQLARQRVIVNHALDTGQRSEMAESLLDALEGSLAYSRSTGYFCSVAADHPAPFCRVTPRRAGACQAATGVESVMTIESCLSPLRLAGSFEVIKITNRNARGQSNEKVSPVCAHRRWRSVPDWYVGARRRG